MKREMRSNLLGLSSGSGLQAWLKEEGRNKEETENDS